ncbi:MAG: hypothetical protein [Caudoviricetes sp.]|nr:MAG: hypothetical protein [Caudoviricetes sp.]
MKDFITVGKIILYGKDDYKKENIDPNKRYKLKMSSRDYVWQIYKNKKWENIPVTWGINIEIFGIMLHRDLQLGDSINTLYKKGKTISCYISYDKLHFSIGFGTMFELKKYGKILSDKGV